MKTSSFKALLLGSLVSAAPLLVKAIPSDSVKSLSKRQPYRATHTRQNDLLHTRLDVKFDWNAAQMTGKASITGKPFARPTSRLNLDARGMQIESVEVFDLSGKPQQGISPGNPEMLTSKKLNASYSYENDSLKINLGREFGTEEKYLVKINYTAKPNELKKGGSGAITEDKGLYFINPKGEEKNKMPQIWTQGETQASSAWFPTIDSPNEKMTSEIYMTVDNKYTTLSNGSLTDSKKNTDGTRTDHWKMDLPHSPYLVMMTVGEFKKVTDKPWKGKEVSYYVEKEYEPYAKGIFGNTGEMIEFYSTLLGTPYPWSKYSQVVVRDYVSGAMENTSATLHGDFMVYQTEREMIDGKKGQAVIAHELFHQWFGDLVTAESWSNLPLNESFATYGEYLWEEYKNGRDAADAHSYKSRMGYYNAAKNRQVEMIRFHYASQEEMFDAWSYNKGGQILHMLRKYVGDKIFFSSLKLYLERNRFKNAEIHDLRLAFEEVSGEDLNWFFNQWFFEKGHPELLIEKSYDAARKQVMLKVKQVQDLKENPLYTLPVDIDVYVNGKKERTRIVIDQAEQEFYFHAATATDLVNFDAERQLLAIKTYTKTNDELMFLYRHAALFPDRMEALSLLKPSLGQENVFQLFLQAAENDPWFELRMNCIHAFKDQAAKREKELRPLMIRIATTDKNTNVRARALAFLSDNYKGEDLTELYRKSASEQSYAVFGASLRALAVADQSLALKKAEEAASDKTESAFEAIATVYTKLGGDEHTTYFVKSRENFSGYGHLTYLYSYSDFLKQCKRPDSFTAAAQEFKEIMRNGNAYVKGEAARLYQEAILDSMKARAEEAKKEGKAGSEKEWADALAKAENLLKSP